MAAPGNPNGYLIFRHEKVRILDILRLLFTRRRLTDYDFVECSSKTALELGDVRGNWILAVVELIHMFLASISTPLYLFGRLVEFILNLLSLNGGLLGLVWHLVTFSLVIPKRGTANFRSIIGFIDGRIDLYKPSSLLDTFPKMELPGDLDDLHLGDLSMMAAKIAYENDAYIKEVVNNQWKMHFVEFFDCWNKFLMFKWKRSTTQAFIFCDKEEDASLICVAFRGTEAFDAKDWMTDFDFSSISMGPKNMGSVHIGFMMALGLQDDKNFANGFPPEPPSSMGDHPLAYYAIRQSLLTLTAKNPNAKILVTGHSLGAALAALFPAVLAFHGQDAILDKMGVYTHAQPRVGDATFATYMGTVKLLQYLRTVFRYDIVPRVPPELPLVGLFFQHFGDCHYYTKWQQLQVVSEVPNKNYGDPKYLFTMYLYAWRDLVNGLFAGRVLGKDFAEGWVSIIYRAVGVLLPVLGPGIASHSPRDYVNAVRLGKTTSKDMV